MRDDRLGRIGGEGSGAWIGWGECMRGGGEREEDEDILGGPLRGQHSIWDGRFIGDLVPGEMHCFRQNAASKPGGSEARPCRQTAGIWNRRQCRGRSESQADNTPTHRPSAPSPPGALSRSRHECTLVCGSFAERLNLASRSKMSSRSLPRPDSYGLPEAQATLFSVTPARPHFSSIALLFRNSSPETPSP